MVVNGFLNSGFCCINFVSFSAYIRLCQFVINSLLFFKNVCWPLKYVLALSHAMTSFKCMTSLKEGKNPRLQLKNKETRDVFYLDIPQFVVTVYLRFRNRPCVNVSLPVELLVCILNIYTSGLEPSIIVFLGW